MHPILSDKGKNIFLYSGISALGGNDNGKVSKPNDRHPLTKDVFRLYYTSLSSDRQTINVYVEDSFGKAQQLTFSFNSEREDGKSKPASSRH